MKGESYSVADIEKLYINLSNQKGNINVLTFKEQLSNISRILVWDDQHNHDLFDFLCEVKMLETLLQIFGSTRDKEVVNAILSFLTILLSNLTRQPSVNYLLSHPVMTCLTLTKFGNMNSQIADYYINFLKVLSRKITLNNLQLFFNQRYSSFPILSQTVRFFNHPQSLVRTTSRNIILTIAKLKSALVDQFMTNFPFCAYYIHESNFLKEYWVISDQIIRDKEENAYELAHLEQLFQDHQEIMIFLDDLLNLDQPQVAQCFTSAFINECLSRLIHSLDTEAKDCFSIQLSLYLLIVLFKTFTHPFISNTLAFIFLGKYHTRQLAEALFDPVPCILSYDKKWKFKGFWDSHEEKVKAYCTEAFHKFVKRQQKPNPNQSQSFIGSWANKIDTTAIFGITNNFYEREVQKIEKIFGLPILSKPESLPSGGGTHMQKVLQMVENSSLDISLCEINSVSGTIESYLMSKDDTLVLLTLTLFQAILQNKSISPSVMNFCKLSLQPPSRDFESVIKIEKLIINCVKLFSVDPPCYRLCTYIEAIDLLKKISSFYLKNQLQFSSDVLTALKSGIKITIDRIIPYLYSGKDWQKVITMYLQVVKFYDKKRYKTLKTFGFLPQETQNSNLNTATDYVYQHFPKEFHHQIARDFWIYFLMRDLFLDFNKMYRFAQVHSPPQKGQNHKYQEGKSYKNIDDEVLFVEYRMRSQEKYVPTELILMTGYFVFIENGVVKKRINYDQFVPLADRSDPRRLFLTGDSQTIWLQLKDASTAQALLLHLQEGRSVLLRYKLSQIVKEVEVYRNAIP